MILRQSTQFKKDLKRFKNKPSKIKDLKAVLKDLKNLGRVSNSHFPHKLSGNYKGHMECHIGSDYLLIWIDESEQIIKLVRLGTHAELFGK